MLQFFAFYRLKTRNDYKATALNSIAGADSTGFFCVFCTGLRHSLCCIYSFGELMAWYELHK